MGGTQYASAVKPEGAPTRHPSYAMLEPAYFVAALHLVVTHTSRDQQSAPAQRREPLLELYHDRADVVVEQTRTDSVEFTRVAVRTHTHAVPCFLSLPVTVSIFDSTPS